MHSELLAQLQTKACLQNYLDIPLHIAIEDAQVNADDIVILNNAQSIAPVSTNIIVPSNVETTATKKNNEMMKIEDYDSDEDSDFSFTSCKALD